MTCFKKILYSFLILAFSCSMPAMLEGNLKLISQTDNTKPSDPIDSHQQLALIENQLAALREGDVDKAYFLYTSLEFKKTTSLKQFKQFIGSSRVFSENKSFHFNSVNFEKAIATFEGTLISKEGEALQTEYDLIQEDGKWKILGIQLFKPETSTSRLPID